MSQQQAFDELGQAMTAARLHSQTSSELTKDHGADDGEDPEDTGKDGNDEDGEDDGADDDMEEEEEYVQHDHAAQGLISYDSVHKQLAAASKTERADVDYEFEGVI